MNPFSIDALNDADLLGICDDGCPSAPEGRAVPPWLRTEKKWRVTPLALEKATLFPPPSGKPAEAFVEQGHLVGQGFKAPMVLFGPAGTGLNTFHRWIRLRTRLAEVRLVDLDFTWIAQSDDPAEQRTRLAACWLGRKGDHSHADLSGLLDRLLLPESPDAPSDDRLRTHILRRVDRLHRENKEILLGRLSDYVGQRALEGARFAILDFETAPLEEAELSSSFLDMCEVYRLGDFTVADVEAMWRDWVPERADQADEVARSCIEWTGGQPVLVNLYLGRLFDAGESFDQAGFRLLDHPPRHALQHWQTELARIAGASTLLRRRVGDLVAGELRSSVTRDFLPLFLAGWIGQDAEGRWSIRSKAHRYWAAGPLRSPESYQGGGG